MATILAVDDSNSLRQMVTFTLREAGFSVLEASNGAEAFDIAKRERADLVLSDVNMPVMDGLQLVRELRALPEYRCTPVLMLTTESSDEKKQAGKAAGATGWLVKPFDPEKLLATVRRVLG
jgi:two-component system chemotaxis response regulator CheY